MSNKYIISIDGGGTKTKGILLDNNDNIVREYQTGFSNFNLDHEITKQHIEETITYLSNNIEGELVIVMGISGESGLKNKSRYIESLEKKYKAKVIIVNDGEIALRAILGEDKIPAALAIGGTGSYFLGLKDKNYYSIGGFGHFLGDDGSAYDLVIRAFKHIIKNYEDTNTYDDFSIKLFNDLKIENVFDLKHLVYNKQKSDVAIYAKHITNYFLDDDKVAKKIIDELIESINNQLYNLFRLMNVNEPIKLGFVGGLITNVKYIKEKILIYLIDKGYSIIFVDNFDAIDGGVFIAKDNF